ncbi:PREDICTED: uncharacterized protein LOC106125221 isoform X2 [Papilio xuthus]|uniref:Uncharacterized protein LOC106125221 isoform X2 n=1 Tax=Papilio xuthus TaxID=66420 RepID=A0AAJ6ZRC7_PAPXU|nr:PREDICTED: uncharacterized protein LOC106125221 isoform X2 [Papilio xuthus]
MDDNEGYDDIIDGSDSETSISRSTTASSIASSMYDKCHFILELHDLKKDKQTVEKRPDSRVKKLKKKTKSPASTKKSESSDSSSGNDDYTLTQSHVSKEQFFDAHESYYGLPDKDPNRNQNNIRDINKVKEIRVITTGHSDRHPHLPQIGVKIPESIEKEKLKPDDINQATNVKM